MKSGNELCDKPHASMIFRIKKPYPTSKISMISESDMAFIACESSVMHKPQDDSNTPMRTQRLLYISVLLFSVIFLIIGNRIATYGLETFDRFGARPRYFPGRITEIITLPQDEVRARNPQFTDTLDYFIVRALWGPFRGHDIDVSLSWSWESYRVLNEITPQIGDRIIMLWLEGGYDIFFVEYVRINYLLILAAVFFALIIWFGRLKGFNSLVALSFTCMSVFLVLIPAILGGRNIYVATIIVCIYAVLSTLFIVIGFNRKAAGAIIGCLGGVILAGGLMLLMDIFLRFTMFIDRDTEMLLWLTDAPIQARSLVFAGVIIGALGAIMDVAMSISSSLWELKIAGGVTEFAAMFKSGISIGKDILGTMLNTLILAYIGSSLSLVLVAAIWTPSAFQILNTELIIVEILRALVGSFGMLLAVPLTSGVCGGLFARKRQCALGLKS